MTCGLTLHRLPGGPRRAGIQETRSGHRASGLFAGGAWPSSASSMTGRGARRGRFRRRGHQDPHRQGRESRHGKRRCQRSTTGRWLPTARNWRGRREFQTHAPRRLQAGERARRPARRGQSQLVRHRILPAAAGGPRRHPAIGWKWRCWKAWRTIRRASCREARGRLAALRAGGEARGFPQRDRLSRPPSRREYLAGKFPPRPVRHEARRQRLGKPENGRFLAACRATVEHSRQPAGAKPR